jgi:hypothetical protein
MKLLLVTMLLVLVAAPKAGAATVSVSHKIYVRAVVAPSRTILVDSNNRIIEIVSNTDQTVEPTAYRGAITAGEQVPLTAEILDDYQKIMAASAKKTGTLYQAKFPNERLELDLNFSK